MTTTISRIWKEYYEKNIMKRILWKEYYEKNIMQIKATKDCRDIYI